jgi:hypothetical protein
MLVSFVEWEWAVDKGDPSMIKETFKDICGAVRIKGYFGTSAQVYPAQKKPAVLIIDEL